MNSLNERLCQFCCKHQFKYTCPKCDSLYCSVDCYKSPAHLKCSEEFYKSCVQEELSSSGPNSNEDIRKMYDILKRMKDYDAGIDPTDFDDGIDEPLDSDDDEYIDEDDTVDLATRLDRIDINNAEEVWEKLTKSERVHFEKAVESGDIMKLLPDYNPWWQKKNENSKIVMLPQNPDVPIIPKIKTDIPKYSSICTKEPSPCLHFNLWNIVAAYACTSRFFSGEHLLSSSEAAPHLVNLSSTLKYGTNFEDAEDAIISVEMESLTSVKNNVTGLKTELVPNRDQLISDARSIMSSYIFKLAVLSDILQLFQKAKNQLNINNVRQAEFQKLYALCIGSTELDKKTLKLLLKKIEFYLSYLNRETEIDLK